MGPTGLTIIRHLHSVNDPFHDKCYRTHSHLAHMLWEWALMRKECLGSKTGEGAGEE